MSFFRSHVREDLFVANTFAHFDITDHTDRTDRDFEGSGQQANLLPADNRQSNRVINPLDTQITGHDQYNDELRPVDNWVNAAPPTNDGGQIDFDAWAAALANSQAGFAFEQPQQEAAQGLYGLEQNEALVPFPNGMMPVAQIGQQPVQIAAAPGAAAIPGLGEAGQAGTPTAPGVPIPEVPTPAENPAPASGSAPPPARTRRSANAAGAGNNNGGEHKCDECPNTYHSPTGLRDHKAAIHRGQMYHCRYCFRVDSDRANHHRHQNGCSENHGFRVRYDCTRCGKHSSRKDNAQRHVRTCTGNVPEERRGVVAQVVKVTIEEQERAAEAAAAAAAAVAADDAAAAPGQIAT